MSLEQETAKRRNVEKERDSIAKGTSINNGVALENMKKEGGERKKYMNGIEEQKDVEESEKLGKRKYEIGMSSMLLREKLAKRSRVEKPDTKFSYSGQPSSEISQISKISSTLLVSKNYYF